MLPYVVLLPYDAFVVCIYLSIELVMYFMSRIFVNPATMGLVNDYAPSPDLLRTVHGAASSASSATHMVGPTIGDLMLGWGLSHNLISLLL